MKRQSPTMEIYCSFVVHPMLDQLLGFKFQDTGSLASGGLFSLNLRAVGLIPVMMARNTISWITATVPMSRAVIRYRRDKFSLRSSEMHQNGMVRNL